ncbi:MAG: hypothetical protein Q9199_000245 [Rusavskia elegans]
MSGTSHTPSTDDAIVELLTSYHELNGGHVDELETAPSPLLFMQYMAKNRPFVLRGGAANWPATSLWDPGYLGMKMGNSRVKVAITPSGSGLSVEEPFDDFLTHIRQQEVGEISSTEVKYSQAPSQDVIVSTVPHMTCDFKSIEASKLDERIAADNSEDDNLHGEYSQLYSDVPDDVSWATECLGAIPDAINVWIGNGQSITALHKDNYENIYCQIRGKKRFVLLPSVETPCVNIRFLPQAIYTRLGSDSVSHSISCRGLRFRMKSSTDHGAPSELSSIS